MTIEYKDGNMFNEPVEAIVNTVNCVGVMGKGVALEFKRRWPQNFKAYKRLCDDKMLSPGNVFVFENNDFLDNKHRYLINFPTKDHWRSKSRIDYINSGLKNLISELRRLDIRSVAMPPLGCGNGGLEWDEVRHVIEDRASELPDVKFIIFQPFSTAAALEQSVPQLEFTIARASMMSAFAELERFFDGRFTRLTAQKISYFLQVLGVDFDLDFSPNDFGPYSEKLHNAFKIMDEKGYIEGYKSDEKIFSVPPGTYAAADEFLKNNDIDISGIVDKLSLLIEGYESPYGMELLASVHFLAVDKGISTQPEMSYALQAWNDHKRDNFPEDAVTKALHRLREDGLIAHIT